MDLRRSFEREALPSGPGHCTCLLILPGGENTTERVSDLDQILTNDLSLMSIIPSTIKCTRVASVDEGLLLSGPVTVSYSGEGADAVAGYLCDYLSESLQLDSLAESQVAAADTEGLLSAALPHSSVLPLCCLSGRHR